MALTLTEVTLLPFLKHKPVAGLIIQTRNPDGGQETEGSSDNQDHAMEAAAEDMLRAISSKDAKALAQAIRAAMEICDSEEDSQEGESKHDYDAQNIKAAKESRE